MYIIITKDVATKIVFFYLPSLKKNSHCTIQDVKIASWIVTGSYYVYTKEDQTIRCLLCGINQIRKTDTLEGDTVKHFLDAAASQYFIYSNFTIQTLILGVGKSNLI